MDRNFNTAGDLEDYKSDTFTMQEFGSSTPRGALVSWQEWRPDAHLVRSRNRVSIDKLISMRRSDGMARAIANLIFYPLRMAILGGKWVAPAEGGCEEEVELANLMWTLPPAAGGMTYPASQVVDQMLLAVSDGFSAFEIVSHIPTSGPLKGKKTLKKLAYRDPRTVTLLQDAHGGYAGFRQQARIPGGGISDTTVSPAKSLLFTVNGYENPLYGASYFESCYPHYESKLKGYYLMEMAAQFAAVPGRIGVVPPRANPADVAAFKRDLENFYFNTTMIHKEGFKVEPFNSSPGFAFMPYIEHQNLMMAKAVLASFMETEQRTVLVENTTQDASADIFLLSMTTLANSFADTITNHLMPKYIRENIKDPEGFPVFKPGPLSDQAKKQIQSMFEKLAISGILNTTPELVRELEKTVASELGIDVDYVEIAAREQEASELQAAQAEALAAQQQADSLMEERLATGAIPNTDASTATNVNPAQSLSPVSTSRVDLDSSYLDGVDALINAAQAFMVSTPGGVGDSFFE